MKKQYDFQKEWEKTKKQLTKFSKEAGVLAQKGEKELVKFSQRSKLHLDSTTLNLKKEHLYYSIGKEYVRIKCPGRHTVKLNKFIGELKQLDKEIGAVKKKITGGK